MQTGGQGANSVKNLLAEFRRSWLPLIGYEAICKALIFLVVAPLATLRADAFALQAGQVTPGFIKSVHAKDKPVYVWTVDAPEEMERFIELGADYLYPNDPAELMALLRHRAAMNPGEKLRKKFKRLLDSIAGM